MANSVVLCENPHAVEYRWPCVWCRECTTKCQLCELQRVLAACGVVVEQQPMAAATVLPTGVQLNDVAEETNVNASLQVYKPSATVNCQPRTAVISGE